MAEQEISRFGVEITNPVWRVSRRKYVAMQVPPLVAQGAGRFDDPLIRADARSADFAVLYVGTSEKAAFIETMAGLRSHLGAQREVLIQSIMEVDDRDGFLDESKSTGSLVTKEWMDDWQLSNVDLINTAPVFDFGDPAAVQLVREQLALTILAMGLHDLDFSNIMSEDRDLTRAISRWIWSLANEDGTPLCSGIRYRSRFDPECICFALYEHRYEVDGDIDTQPITPATPGFAEAAHILR